MASPESWNISNLAPRSPQRGGREGEWDAQVEHRSRSRRTKPRGFYRPTAVSGACKAPRHATAVTAPSGPATAGAAVGFDPHAALAGYRSLLRGLVLLPPWGFSRRIRAFAEMTGSPQCGYAENVRHVCREHRNARTSRFSLAHRSAGQTGIRREHALVASGRAAP
jgi:hypothetical protein